MDQYVTGGVIRTLREKKGLTQKQLADALCVSDKTVSKWENCRGLPDISLLEPLAAALGVSAAELLAGACVVNKNRSASLRRARFYVCPVCGNLLVSMGEGAYSCCGVRLPPLVAEAPDAAHAPTVSRVENGQDLFVTLAHPMEKGHSLSFFALVTPDGLRLKKLYPEQAPEARFAVAGHGTLCYYCNRDGLFAVTV